MTKESPYFPTFEAGLAKLRESGALKTIVNKFIIDEEDDSQCEPRKVRIILFLQCHEYTLWSLCLQTRLGFAQTFFPFGCLILGAGIAIKVAIVECYNRFSKNQRRRKWKKTQEYDEKSCQSNVEQKEAEEMKVLHKIWDNRKYTLTRTQLEAILSKQE